MAQQLRIEPLKSPVGSPKRLVFALCMLTALLFTQSSALSPDWTAYRNLNLFLDGDGTIGAVGNVDLPAVPPQGVSPTIVSESRCFKLLHEPAAAQASGSSVVVAGSANLADISSVPLPTTASHAVPVCVAAYVQQRAPPHSI